MHSKADDMASLV